MPQRERRIVEQRQHRHLLDLVAKGGGALIFHRLYGLPGPQRVGRGCGLPAAIDRGGEPAPRRIEKGIKRAPQRRPVGGRRKARAQRVQQRFGIGQRRAICDIAPEKRAAHRAAVERADHG